MKKKLSLILALTMLLSGCNTEYKQTETKTSTTTTATAISIAVSTVEKNTALTTTTVTTAKTTVESVNTEDLSADTVPLSEWDSKVWFSGGIKTNFEKTEQEIVDLFFQIINGEILPCYPDDDKTIWGFEITDGTESYTLTKKRTNAGWCYSYQNMQFPVNEKLEEYVKNRVKGLNHEFELYFQNVVSFDGDYSPLVGYSYKLKNPPQNNFDYCNAALVTIKDWWLKNNGNVDNFSDYFNYDDFKCYYKREINGTLYIGAYIKSYVLFTVEGDICTIKSCSDKADFQWMGGFGGSDCFYDYLNDEEYMAKLYEEMDELEYGYGKAFFHSSDIIPVSKDSAYRIGVYTNDIDDRGIAISNGQSTVYKLAYTNTELGRLEFPMYFDDYNGDGVPEFALNHMSAADGSYYNIYPLTYGRDDNDYWGKHVFVKNAHQKSMRLQLYGIGRIVAGLSMDEPDTIGTFDIDGNDFYFTEVPQFNMYSQRYYLPNQKKAYPYGTDEIIFYLWNNTNETVTLGGEYVIERLTDGEWIEEGVSGTLDECEITPAMWAEYTVDVTGISPSNGGINEYRLKLTNGENIIYGGFYMGESKCADFSISEGSKKLMKSCTEISFKIKNESNETLFVDSAKLYKDGVPSHEIMLSNNDRVIDAGAETELTLTAAENEVFGGHSYTLELISENNVQRFTYKKSDTSLKSLDEQFPVTITEKDGIYTAVITNLNENERDFIGFSVYEARVYSETEQKPCYGIKLCQQNILTFYNDCAVTAIPLAYGESTEVELITNVDMLTDEECWWLCFHFVDTDDEITDARDVLREIDFFAKPEKGDKVTLYFSYYDGNDEGPYYWSDFSRTTGVIE